MSSQNLGEAGYNVLIQSQENMGSNARTIMSLSPDNIMQHGGATEPNRRYTPAVNTDALEPAFYFVINNSLCSLRDNLVLTKSGSTEFRFRLAGVQLTDRGFYWCDITALIKQQPGQSWNTASVRARAESNKVRIDFQENGELPLCSYGFI